MIKKSNVSRKFINDFIRIQQSNRYSDQYPFIVDLDLVVIWLHITQKEGIKKTLITSYNEGIDFLVRPSSCQKTGSGGHNEETILLTVPCFKKLAIRSKGEMGGKVIEYYLALEELVLEYQQLIITELSKRVKSLEYDLNPEIYPEGGIVYILDLGNGYYKLGFTGDLNERMKIYQTGMIHKKKVAFWFETTDALAVESCVKGFVLKNAIRKGKEVYHVPLDSLIELIKKCDNILVTSGCISCEKMINPSEMDAHIETNHSDLNESVVKVSLKDFVQKGGNRHAFYYKKYLKYKTKYLELRHAEM